MAREIEILDRSRVAAADLSASQYCAVVLDTNGKVNLPSGATVPIYGVLQNKPTSGQTAEVRVMGVTKLVTNATGITNPGDRVGVDSAGKGQTDTTSGHYVIGLAEDSGTSPTICTVLLNCPALAKN